MAAPPLFSKPPAASIPARAVEGALLSVGDPHASQGDSELCGTAIECSLTGTFQFILHPKASLAGTPLETLDYPLLETQTELKASSEKGAARSKDIARGVGNYVVFQDAAGGGIRPTPYSTDLAVNDATYQDVIAWMQLQDPAVLAALQNTASVAFQ